MSINRCIILALAALLSSACSKPDNGNSITMGDAPTGESTTQETSSSDGEDPTTVPPAGNSEGSPCSEEGGRLCEADAIFTCQGGQWVFVETCVAPMTCSFESITCVERACERGDKRCIDDQTIQFCSPDQTRWQDPQACGEEAVCINDSCVGQDCFPGVMFLVDRSTSMGESWDNVARALEAVIRENESVRFGLSVFPSEAPPDSGWLGSLSGCNSGEGWPNIPIASDAGDDIANWFGRNGVTGATPLEGAMEWFAQNSTEIWNGEEAGYLVVVSDGEDTCTGDDSCGNDCVAEYLAIHTRALARQNVKTYVIGYNYDGSPIELNAIAANGGTSFTDYVYAGGEDMLAGVFEEFIREIKECQ